LRNPSSLISIFSVSSDLKKAKKEVEKLIEKAE